MDVSLVSFPAIGKKTVLASVHVCGNTIPKDFDQVSNEYLDALLQEDRSTPLAPEALTLPMAHLVLSGDTMLTAQVPGCPPWCRDPVRSSLRLNVRIKVCFWELP